MDEKRKHLRPETVNLLDENTGETLQDLGIVNDFTDRTRKAQATKAKMDEWDYTKRNSFCTAMNTMERVKSNLQNGRKHL